MGLCCPAARSRPDPKSRVSLTHLLLWFQGEVVLFLNFKYEFIIRSLEPETSLLCVTVSSGVKHEGSLTVPLYFKASPSWWLPCLPWHMAMSLTTGRIPVLFLLAYEAEQLSWKRTLGP